MPALARISNRCARNLFCSTFSFSNVSFSPVHSTRPRTSPTMIPRTLLRQTRAVSSSIRTIPGASLARPQFCQSNLSFAPASRPATSRWYSTEPEIKKTEAGGAAAESKAEEKAAGAGDPAKKELEAKNKEIIDLKVTLLPLPSYSQHFLTLRIKGSISPLGSRIPQSTRENQTGHAICERLRPAKIRQGPR
jgi:hypothetical protein